MTILPRPRNRFLVNRGRQFYTDRLLGSLDGTSSADHARRYQTKVNVMQRTIFLGIVLCCIWLLWSGHYRDPFLLLIGIASVTTVVLLAVRMRITDDEGMPTGLGLRPVTYSIWLAKEIIESNIEVTRLIMDPKLPIRPRMIRVNANQKTELGRVIFANSITLTPGTVSVDMQGDRIWVHALSFDGAEEDLSGDMDSRVSKLGV